MSVSRITEEDIEDALEAPSLIPPETTALDTAEIVKLAGNELFRRLEEEPEKLPTPIVAKLYMDGTKALAAAPVKNPDGQVDILAALDSLPAEHARELLTREISSTKAKLGLYEERLKGLT